MPKDLREYTKEELLDYIKTLKRAKKFGLVWEDKPEQVVDDVASKLPVLEEVSDRAIIHDTTQPTHLIIEGDNYHSLSTLNYTHANAVDIIYIDPPYNTGNKDFIYNDRYIDKEDSFRHSKWLSFMSKRLLLAKELLKEDGVIFISIDENEFSNLNLLCDQIFGEENRIADFIWKNKKGGGNDSRHVAKEHEYVLFYAKNKALLPKLFIPMDEDYAKRYKFEDEVSKYFWDTFKRKSGKQYYPITAPDGTILEYDENGNKISWLRSEARFKTDIEIGDARFVKIKDKWSVQFKQRIPEGKKPRTIVDDVATTSDGSAELLSIFGRNLFDNPKPTALLRHILKSVDKHDAVILDFMAGSGTTGHATLQLNRDGGTRQFILCTNNENGIAENITYERIKKVTQGYGSVEGIPANVRYLKTGFVDKQKTNDQTRMAIIDRSADLIRVRENAFETLIDDKEIKVYKGTGYLAAIIFETDEIPAMIKRIEKLNQGTEVHLYLFSLSNYAYQDELISTKLDITACPIPESVLEVYQRIFRKAVK